MARHQQPSRTRPGRGMTRDELATAVNQWLHDHRVLDADVDANYVGKLERGQYRWPTKTRRQALRAVLGDADDLELGMYIVRGTRSATPAFAGPAESGRGSPSGSRSRASFPGHLPEQDEALAHLRQQWHLLVQADNLFGPRHALAGVETQVMLLRDLLTAAQGRVRNQVLDLAARYAESAAWLNQDLAQSKAAQEWTAQALEWAHQRNDIPMVTWSIYRRSQQQLEAGRARDALDLAQAALRHDTQLGDAARAAIRVQQAHASAALGERDAMRLLDQAHPWAADDQRGDAGTGHGSFCTSGYIEVHRATCLRLIGRADQAVAVFDQAIPTIPRAYRRDTALALADKSAAQAAAGQPDAAATTALTALSVARRVGSQRIIVRLAAVSTRLRPHQRLESVARLIDELATA